MEQIEDVAAALGAILNAQNIHGHFPEGDVQPTAVNERQDSERPSDVAISCHQGPVLAASDHQSSLPLLKACVQLSGWSREIVTSFVTAYGLMKSGFIRPDVFWLIEVAKRSGDSQMWWMAARIARNLGLRQECHRLCLLGIADPLIAASWRGRMVNELVMDLMLAGDYQQAREHLQTLINPDTRSLFDNDDFGQLFHIRLLAEIALVNTTAAIQSARYLAQSIPELADNVLILRASGLLAMLASDWRAAQPMLQGALALAVAQWPMLPEYHEGHQGCTAWGLVDCVEKEKPPIGMGGEATHAGFQVWSEPQEQSFGHQRFPSVLSPRSDLFSLTFGEGEVIFAWLNDAWVEATVQNPGIAYLHSGCNFHSVSKLFVVGLKDFPSATSLQGQVIERIPKAVYLHWSGGNYFTFSCEVVAKILLLRQRGLLNGGHSNEGDDFLPHIVVRAQGCSLGSCSRGRTQPLESLAAAPSAFPVC